jgi:hypothetical protein
MMTPSAVMPSPGACLDDLLVSRFLPKRWIQRIWSANELPQRLQRCTGDLVPGSEWRAYGDQGQIFFAIARMHESGARDARSTAIDAYFLDANAAVYAAGVWEYDHQNGWWLDAVMDLSYDCESGWWIEAVVDSNSSIRSHRAALPPGGVDFRILSASPSNPAVPRRSVARRGKVRT